MKGREVDGEEFQQISLIKTDDTHLLHLCPQLLYHGIRVPPLLPSLPTYLPC